MLVFFCTLLLLLQPDSLPKMGLPQSIALLATMPHAAHIAQAPVMSPQQALERLFTTPEIQADWFTPAFLQQVSATQIQGVISQITQNLGEYQSVAETEAGFEVRFEHGTVPAQIELDSNGQITSLFFQPAITPISPEEAASAIQEAPYSASLLILKNGEEQANVSADQPLAVGSAFKLAALAALQEQVQTEELSWDTVVELQPEWKSLPSGILQDWPIGSALTIETLATLMISISDNTATDALINIVGRENIEALTPRNQPFLTTREFFTLKNPANASWLERYRAGDLDTQQQVLTEVPNLPLPAASVFAGDPISLDVEWFFTGQELCQLIEQVAPLSAMRVNPGVANPADWQQVAFKGGSEPGVLNLTTWLVDQAGDTYCVTTTWNNPDQALDETALSQFHQGAIAGLKSDILPQNPEE